MQAKIDEGERKWLGIVWQDKKGAYWKLEPWYLKREPGMLEIYHHMLAKGFTGVVYMGTAFYTEPPVYGVFYQRKDTGEMVCFS